MAEYLREMIDRWDAEDNERRRLLGEDPHGRNWPYLTLDEIAAGWGVNCRSLAKVLSAPEMRTVIAGEEVIYKRGGSKDPAHRVSLGAFQRIRQSMDERYAGKRTFRDLDTGMFVRTKGEASGTAKCISINGIPTPDAAEEIEKRKALRLRPVEKRETDREIIDSWPLCGGKQRDVTPYLTVQEIAKAWQLPPGAVRNVFKAVRDATVRDAIRHYNRNGRGQPLLRIGIPAFRFMRDYLNREDDGHPLPDCLPPAAES